MAKKRSISKKQSQLNTIKNLVKSQVFPLLICFSILGILFVLIRMKGIEQDYKFNEIVKNIKAESNDNKALKANKARLLSVKKLKSFANKHNLKEPDEKHIILIP